MVSRYELKFGLCFLVKLKDCLPCVGNGNCDSTGELKRMYLIPSYQHKGLGSVLLNKALALAKDCGYTSIRLDTLSTMTLAINLYKKNGFIETEAYYNNPMDTVVYFEKLL
jgi:ribosomal protein S18 acetylase RimI-like enzyme